jgi:hypothetical protein
MGDLAHATESNPRRTCSKAPCMATMQFVNRLLQDLAVSEEKKSKIVGRCARAQPRSLDPTTRRTGKNERRCGGQNRARKGYGFHLQVLIGFVTCNLFLSYE